MIKAVYPGSFDPVTQGHMDIIDRAVKVVDELVVGVLVNTSKSCMFTLDERVEFLREATKGYPNVKVEKFEGMTVEFAHLHDAKIIIRGLRAITDLVSEMSIAQTNRYIDDTIDTMFFATDIHHSFLSSTVVKEILAFNGDISGLVPDCVETMIKNRKLKQ